MDIHCYGNGMFIGDICRRRVLMTYSNGYLHVMSAHATTEHITKYTYICTDTTIKTEVKTSK